MKGRTFFDLEYHGLTVEEFDKGLLCGGIVFPWRREYIVGAADGDGWKVAVPAGSYLRDASFLRHDPWYSRQPRTYTLTGPEQCLEVIRVLQTDPLCLACIEYVSIEEGDAPLCHPLEEDWSFSPLEDGVCVDGYHGDPETILVPAAIGGRPVRRLCLDRDALTEACRTLILSEGIAEVSLDFENAGGLRRFVFPASGRLLDSPRGIQQTQWFRRQERKPVYLGGYYCGTPGGGWGRGTELRIEEGTAAVAYGADYHCYWRRIIMPDSVKRIDQLAFADARCLEELQLPAGVERIGDFAFQCCPRLRKLDLPDTICHASVPFMLCTGLREVSMSATCPIRRSFDQCARLILREQDGRRVIKRGVIPPRIAGTLHACPAEGPMDIAGRYYANLSTLTACRLAPGLYRDRYGNLVQEMIRNASGMDGEEAEASQTFSWYLRAESGLTEILFDETCRVYLVREGLAQEDLSEEVWDRLDVRLKTEDP